MVLLVVFVAFALGVSFLCSLLEATLLAARTTTLTHLQEDGSRGARLLLALKQDRLDDSISAILILNTMSNTLGATMAGAQAGRVFASPWVGVFSGVLTLAILIISEIIPKTLGAVYTRELAPFTGWALMLMTRLLHPVLVLSRLITRLLTRDSNHVISKGEVAAFISTATAHGALGEDEARMLSNLLRFNEIRIEDVMTPRTVLFTMPVDATIEELLTSPEANAFSRIPLYRGDADEIEGYVLKIDVLKAVANGAPRDMTLDRFKRPVSFVPELATVGRALQQLVTGREPLAIATDEHDGIAGLVTIEDLTETVLGVEIVDESDRIVDMRLLAARLRAQRIERMRRKRQLPLEKEPQWSSP